MKTIATEITINASAEKVWNVLMNHDGYGEWNPFITEVTGEPVVGQTIAATICLPGKKPMKFTPTVLKNDEAMEFRWLGSTFVKGLFDGEHYKHTRRFFLQLQGNLSFATTIYHIHQTHNPSPQGRGEKNDSTAINYLLACAE